MNKRHYEHTLPNIRGSLSNTYVSFCFNTILNNTNLTRNYKLFAIDVLPTPRIGHDISLNYRFGFCSIGPDIQS